jgi:hypothetical protein
LGLWLALVVTLAILLTIGLDVDEKRMNPMEIPGRLNRRKNSGVC